MIPAQIAFIVAIAIFAIIVFWDELRKLKIPWGAMSFALGISSLYIGLQGNPLQESVPASVSSAFMSDSAMSLSPFILFGAILVIIGGISLYGKYKK